MLITGAKGFIGGEIVLEVLKNKHEVFGVLNSKSEGEKDFADTDLEMTFYSADITDSRRTLELAKIGKIDAIIHSAGLAHQFGDTKKEEFDRVNVEGTRNIANLASILRVKHFILISSTAVYGIEPADDLEKHRDLKDQIEFDENTQTRPQTLYARSKLEAEKVCREICEENNLPLTIFRLSPVIGEANVGNVARLINAIDRRRFVWIGRGENLKSLIYKKDVARACVTLIENKSGDTEIFNLSAEPVRMRNFVGDIARCLNKNIYKFYIPKSYVRKIFWINSHFVRNKKLHKIEVTIEKWLSDDVYSAKKIAESYGFEPKTSISEAIERQIEWYKNQKSRTAKN